MDPISSSFTNVGGLGAAGTSGAGAAKPAAGFADAISNGLDSVSKLEHQADAAIQDVAAGGETSVHELMTSTAKAQLGVEVLAQVRDRAIEAYQEIMRMQV